MGVFWLHKISLYNVSFMAENPESNPLDPVPLEDSNNKVSAPEGQSYGKVPTRVTCVEMNK